jgi:hypothetical protein
MPELLDTVIGLIKELRNSQDANLNWTKFHSLVKQNQDIIIANFSIRWLRSICDTYADYGDDCERRDALVISVFINMVRFAETVRYVHGDLIPENLKEAKTQRLELYEGLSTFHIDKQDVFLNMSKRLSRQLSGSDLFKNIWREVLRRLLDGDNVITEFRGLSAIPERYFPLDPLDMQDNYGVT